MPQDLRSTIQARRQARSSGAGVTGGTSPALSSLIAERRRARSTSPARPRRERGFLDSLADSVQSFLRRDIPMPDIGPEEMRGGPLPTVLRVASGFGKGPVGALMGAGGELAAQTAEGRDDYNWTQVATQGVLGAIPFKVGRTALRTMLRGSGTGALMATGSEAAEQFHERDFDAGRLAGSAVLGAGLGTVGGAVADRLSKIAARRAARKANAAEVVFNDQTVTRTIPPSGRTPSPAPPAARAAAAPSPPSPPPPDDLVAPIRTAEEALAPRAIDVMGIGGPAHAEAVMQRIRASRGQVRFPRGTSAAEMLERSASDVPYRAPSSIPSLGAGMREGAPVTSTVPRATAEGQPFERTAGDFDAPLTAEELARAAEPIPPPTRLSPAAKRRARRQKLQEALQVKATPAADAVPETQLPAGGHFEDIARPNMEGVDPRFIDPATGKIRIPAEIVAARRDLLPRWQQDRAAQEGLEGLGGPTVPEEDLISMVLRHARRMDERSPRDFMGRERKAHAQLYDRLKASRQPEVPRTDPMSETGAISPDLLFDIGGIGGGAALGSLAGVALEEDDQVGVVGGALAGGLLGARIRRPGAIRSLQYGSMLSSPITMAKGAAGSVGSSLLSGLEKNRLGTVAREMMRPETLKAGARGFMEGGAPGRYRGMTTRPGSPLNPLSWSGRILGSTDAAMQDVMQRAGFSPEEAAQQILTGDPTSTLGRWLVNFQRQGGAAGIGEDLLPFARTIVNAVERGTEALPGVGFHPRIRSMRNLSVGDSAKKQGIGLLAMLAGLASGEQAAEHEDGSWGRRLWSVAPVATGPYSLLASAAHAGSIKAHEDEDATPYSISNAAVTNAREALPLPEVPTVPEWLKRNAPRDLTAAVGQNPSDYDTKGSFVAPLLARLPYLNERLLEKKRAASRRRISSRRATRTSRARGAR